MGKVVPLVTGVGCGCALVIAVIVVAIVGSGAMSTSGGTGSSASRDAKPDHDKLEAYSMCKQFVRDKLKAPSTAKFARVDYSERTVYLGDATYEVASYVDAQNAFGATLRNHYVCRVRWVEGDRWMLEGLEFG